MDASPIAVSNKIKAIQARKTRLNPLPTDTSYTDVRPLNFRYNAGVTNPKANVTVWTAERLVDRSKDLRLDRISTRQLPRPSPLSTTSINQPSVQWPNYQVSTLGNKKLRTHSNSTTTTPPAISSIKNKTPGGQMPEIPRRGYRQPLADRQNSFIPVKPQQKSPQNLIRHSSERIINNNPLPIYEPEEEEEEDDNNEREEEEEEEKEEEEVPVDKEFEQYFERAIVKCADWLLKYVFIEKNN